MSNRRQVLINMGALSPREKENCVRMLSEKNVKFSQAGNGEFQATIVVQHPNTQPSTATPKKGQRDTTPVKPVTSHENPYAGKKPLNDVVNMAAYPRLLSLCKYVEVYICPKRLTQRTLLDLTENLFHQYFKKHRFEEMIRSQDSLTQKQSFCQFVFEQLSRRQKQPVKLQQLLVNLIESVNFFKGKIVGVKIFAQFLSESYRLQEMIFFYFLRKMLEDIKETKIVERDRLKTDLNLMAVEEQYVLAILNSFCHNKQQSEEEFERIKGCMNYDSKRRKNVILAYDLLAVFLDSFRVNQLNREQELQKDTALEESYQHPKLLEPAKDTQNKYGTKELKQLLQYNSEEPPVAPPAKEKFSPQQNTIFVACLQALKEMCNRVNTPLPFYDRFADLVSRLLYCIFNKDKLSWFRHTSLQPTNGRLHYIESLQREYEQMMRCSPAIQHPFLNKFVKRVLQAPGFYETYAQFLLP